MAFGIFKQFTRSSNENKTPPQPRPPRIVGENITQISRRGFMRSAAAAGLAALATNPAKLFAQDPSIPATPVEENPSMDRSEALDLTNITLPLTEKQLAQIKLCKNPLIPNAGKVFTPEAELVRKVLTEVVKQNTKITDIQKEILYEYLNNPESQIYHLSAKPIEARNALDHLIHDVLPYLEGINHLANAINENEKDPERKINLDFTKITLSLNKSDDIENFFVKLFQALNTYNYIKYCKDKGFEVISPEKEQDIRAIISSFTAANCSEQMDMIEEIIYGNGSIINQLLSNAGKTKDAEDLVRSEKAKAKKPEEVMIAEDFLNSPECQKARKFEQVSYSYTCPTGQLRTDIFLNAARERIKQQVYPAPLEALAAQSSK